jgi:transposase
MPQNPLRAYKIRRLLHLCLVDGFSRRQTAKRLKIAPSCVKRYVEGFGHSALKLSDLEHLDGNELSTLLFSHSKLVSLSSRKMQLLERMQWIHCRIESEGLSLLEVWREEVRSNRCGYKYSQFCSVYANWLREQGISRPVKRLVSIKSSDLETLKSWQRSYDRRKWEVSIALQGLSAGKSLSEVCNKIARGRRIIKRWCQTYEHVGIDGLPIKRVRRLSEEKQDAIRKKKQRLIKIIHETPKAYGINRASWSLKALSDAYGKTHGEGVSRSLISEYFIAAGYKFKKAKRSLTSDDPHYREKLIAITNTLAHLASDEKFFSADEFGPFSVKIRGGTALVPGDEIRTIPQRQKSKGSLICTAALELATNQVIHFYSKRKNSQEMIKLLLRLIRTYKGQRRIFVSWDSASWHDSKSLGNAIDKMNDEQFRRKHNTPIVDLRPLPSGAQFLNVIESVFSGMARAILHNSNYGSVEECKAAIDSYFAERNRAFLEHPRRAGNKIWGKEQVEATFREENNCKDPRWR